MKFLFEKDYKFSMSFRILLTEKIKNNSIREIVNVIEAIQSYDFDWEFYLISGKEEKPSSLERITPIPCSSGGLSFLSFIFDEEKLVEYLPYKHKVKEKIKELLIKGYQPSRVIKASVLEDILDRYPEILTHCVFEVALPLSEDRIEEESLLKGVFEEYEIVKTEYYYLDPLLVKAILEEVYYLYEYLERFSQVYEKERKEAEGFILLLRGTFPVSATLTEMENIVEESIKPVRDMIYERVLIYNRLIPIEKLF